jgi:4-hydroxybenzoate polyprenyltransferase
LQDEEFDRANGLHSIPETFGKAGALRLSESLHAICAGLLIFTGFYGNFGYLYILATILFIAMLIWQHRLVKPNDLSRVDMAFFTANGVASLVFGLLVTGDLYF